MGDHKGAAAALAVARRLPALLDAAGEIEDEAQARHLRRLVTDTLGRDAGRLETYYGLLLMDGDRMGAWLAGGDEYAVSYRESFHPQVRDGFDEQARSEPALQRYAAQKRAVSPKAARLSTSTMRPSRKESAWMLKNCSSQRASAAAMCATSMRQQNSAARATPSPAGRARMDRSAVVSASKPRCADGADHCVETP
jgi:hypothetical protein